MRPKTSSPPPEGPIHILLVDDQPGKLITYQVLLEELGETLLTASSAREALRLLLKNEVAVILIDVNMPEVDGYELAEMIRQHPRFEKTAMMFVSGESPSDLDRIRGYSAGAVDYVSVPVVPEILRAKVRAFVDLYRKTRQLQALNQHLEHRIALRTADLEASTARLQESEERLRMALTSARAGAWDLRFDTGEMRWSPELFSLLGLPQDSPVPALAGPIEHVHPEDRALVLALLEALHKSQGPLAQEPFELEFRVSEQEHERHWMRMTGEVTRDAQGKAIEARGILQDATSRKLAELALEQEARYKDELLATLAHELRNPLAPMAACVRLLRQTPPGEPGVGVRERHLTVLERQATHLKRRVRDLLDVSRLARGTISLLREPIDLVALVRDTLGTMTRQLSGHLVTLALPEQPLRVSVDPVRFAQVLSHLIDNAAKFTPAGGRIGVTLQRSDRHAELKLIDAGRGIDPMDLERVFQLFTQVDVGSGRMGLGIGLALVRRLVELHGGQVWAHSEGLGLGTQVTVRLPHLDERVTGSTAAIEPDATLPPLRILVVDDNADVAGSLAELLQMAGHEVYAAHDGREALTLGASQVSEVVLMDLGMPAPDGFETARQMRQTTWGRQARLIALTGWAEPFVREQTSRAGFDGCLLKPVDLEELSKLLRTRDTAS